MLCLFPRISPASFRVVVALGVVVRLTEGIGSLLRAEYVGLVVGWSANGRAFVVCGADAGPSSETSGSAGEPVV